MITVTFDNWMYIYRFALFVGKNKGGSQWHIDIRKSRVRALDCTRPQPRDDSELLSNQWFQIWPLTRHLYCNLNGRVKMANALLSLLAHPDPIVANILG